MIGRSREEMQAVINGPGCCLVFAAGRTLPPEDVVVPALTETDKCRHRARKYSRGIGNFRRSHRPVRPADELDARSLIGSDRPHSINLRGYAISASGGGILEAAAARW